MTAEDIVAVDAVVAQRENADKAMPVLQAVQDEEHLGTSAVGFVGRGFSTRVKPALNRPLGEIPGEGRARHRLISPKEKILKQS